MIIIMMIIVMILILAMIITMGKVRSTLQDEMTLGLLGVKPGDRAPPPIDICINTITSEAQYEMARLRAEVLMILIILILPILIILIIVVILIFTYYAR